MEANMKDIIARLATHQTTPISTCDDDHDDYDDYDDVDNDVDGGSDEDDGGDDGGDEIKASFALGFIPDICHFFTLTYFEAWKFYTQKCVNLRQNCIATKLRNPPQCAKLHT